MSYLVASGQQTRWKDSCASSAKVNLTLIANGENIVQLYTPSRNLVQAGFDAPTIAPTVADGGSGTLPAGYVAYAYVYASSLYPGVEAQQTAGGFLYPKSNPSPASAVYHITASHQNVVTVTKSDRSDVDTIFIYRTAIKSTSDEAQALADAGEMFYVGMVDDNPVPGTTVFADNVASTTDEQMELDNYVSPQFWLSVYDGTFWWGWGNPQLIVQVTLVSFTSITADEPTFYSGRQNQIVTFDGIGSGGFDGMGSFYFRYHTSTVAQVSVTPDGAAASVAASGTTTMRVHGPASTLYRSKPNNPFAWGITNYFSDGTGGFTREPELYALNIGGGSGSAIAIMQTEALLKLDCENPNGSYVLNLRLGGESPVTFGQSKRKLDGQYTIASHHAQFYATLPDGSTNLAGIDAANSAIVLANSSSQNRFGSEVVNTVNNMVTTDDYPRLFHGFYDPNTELSIFYLKTSNDPHNIVHIDTCLMFHAPTGQWSTFRDFDVTASCAIFDPVALETFILVGTANGKIAKAFVADTWNNLSLNTKEVRTFVVPPFLSAYYGASFVGLTTDPPPAAGLYFDCGDTAGPVRVWLNSTSSPVGPPPPPFRGRLLEVPDACDGDIGALLAAIGVAFTADGAFTVQSVGATAITWFVTMYGECPAPNTGTVGAAMSIVQNQVGSGGIVMTPAAAYDPGSWCLISFPGTEIDGSASVLEFWTRANAGGAFDQSCNFFPPGSIHATPNTVTNFPELGEGAAGNAYIALIDCEAQMQFQTDQTKAATKQEIWAQFEWPGASPGSAAARFYSEFQVNQFGADMPFLETKLQTNIGQNDSSNYIIRDVPSVLTTSFGCRVIERGYTDFQVLGLNFKVSPTK